MRHAADLDDYELQVDELRGFGLWFAMLVLLPLSLLLLCAADGAPATVRRFYLAAAAIACTVVAYAAQLLMLLVLASVEGA